MEPTSRHFLGAGLLALTLVVLIVLLVRRVAPRLIRNIRRGFGVEWDGDRPAQVRAVGEEGNGADDATS